MFDNDGDSKPNYPQDPDCDSARDDSEAAECVDGLDNDGDGKADHPDDQGCASAADNSEAPDASQCADRLDNDGDGLTNLADRGCDSAADDSESGEPQCDDARDNDGDGEVDFGADRGCESAADDTESPDPPVGFSCGRTKGHGQLSTRPKTHFSFHTKAEGAQQKGDLSYHDEAARVLVHGTEFSSVVVSGKTVKIVGSGQVNHRPAGFELTATDEGPKGQGDSFTLKLSDGYAVSGAVRQGDIDLACATNADD